MQKVPSLFQRNYDGDRLVRDEVVSGCEWVLAGEGVATRKMDGTSCLVQDGKLYKRFDARKGKSPPEGFIPAQEPNETSGHWPGWVLVGNGPEDRWHREAWASICVESGGFGLIPCGTYELIGPKVQGNPEGAAVHVLTRHGAVPLDAPRDFTSLQQYLRFAGIEGIVWHHPDGRMCKIKAKDFGFSRADHAASSGE